MLTKCSALINRLIVRKRLTLGYIFKMEYSKIYAISDLHVDYKENLSFVDSWSPTKYKNDCLIVAGDVTDNLRLLEKTLKTLTEKFKDVFYVSGNHELWIRNDSPDDSITKFHVILDMCDRIGVHCKAREVKTSEDESVWVVPLFSWYAKPEEDPEDSLYRKPTSKFTEDIAFGESVWMDNHLCKWTKLHFGQTASMYFSALNIETLSKDYGGKPILSFSHFLPRFDLIPSDDSDNEEVLKVRMKNGLGPPPKFQGGTKGFNFTRYAGSKILESQIRKLGSCIHVYGHQHRNRDRVIDDVRYVSHCLGNPRDLKEGWVWSMDIWKGPKLIWPNNKEPL